MKLAAVRLAVAAVLGACLAAPAWAGPPPSAPETCTHTTLSILPPPACIGSFFGELDGSADELALLQSSWNLSFDYLGRSDEADFGPFASNPQVAFNGSLAFDEKHSGQFVLGLVSAGKHSFYLINTKRNIGGLVFDSLEGVATGPQGNPFPLDYAALFVARAAAIPEPGSVWMLIAGLGLVGLRRLSARRA